MTITEDLTARLAALDGEIAEIRRRMAELRREEAGGEFPDHTLTAWSGEPVRLSELFGEKDDLVLVHNMGAGCPYCTLWADGLNGVRHHIEDRAAFVVVSPDEPAVQQAFAEGRGWGFRMLSAHGTTFNRDARFEDEDGSPWPGVSTFRRDEDGGVVRVSRAPFGPGDEFCAVWHLFDLLGGGANGWAPKFEYGSRKSRSE